VVREKIDWDILGGELNMAEEEEEKGDFYWYEELEENTPYEKLKLLRQACCSTMISGTIFESPNASTKRPDASDSSRTPGAPRALPAFWRHSASVRPRAEGVPGHRATSGRRCP